MISFSNFLNKFFVSCKNFLFALIFLVWQYFWKIIRRFFAKKTLIANKEINAWRLNSNVSNSAFFRNKNAVKSRKIRPFKRKVRGLDIENGGFEQSDDKTQKHIQDIWDDRAKNLLKIGQVSPISSTNKKAMLFWYANLLKTQEKLEFLGKKAKRSKKKLDIPKQIGNQFDSSKTTTFAQKVSATKKLDDTHLINLR